MRPRSVRRGRQAGFGLTEILVGVVIGLLSMVVVMQAQLNFEGQKRTTVGGNDARESGLLGLHAVETDLRMAGQGFTYGGMMDCTSINAYYNGSVLPNMTLQPVAINSGGSAGSDTVTITYSDSPVGGTGTQIVKAMPDSSAVLTVNAATGLKVNDLVLVSTPGSSLPCSLLQVTALQTTGQGQNIIHNSGLSVWNPPGGSNIFPPGGYGLNPPSIVMDMGSFVRGQYQVMCNTLVLTNLTTTPGTPSCSGQNSFTNAQALAGNVVRLKAQYGVAPAGSQSVTCWVNATNGGNPCDAGNWAQPTAAQVARIKAVRLAVVVRSPLMEKTSVSRPCVNASGGVNNGPCAWTDTAANPAPVIDLSADPNWQRYRYTAWSSIIPLRNVLWANL